MQLVEIDKQQFNCPTKWGEVTVRQFFRLRNEPADAINVYAIMLGCDRALIERCKQFDLHQQLQPLLAFLHKPVEPADSRIITFDSKEYHAPKDIGEGSFIQYTRLHERMAKVVKETGSTIDAIPYAVALYMQPIVQGVDFKTELAEAFIDTHVMQASITEATAVGNFFLRIAIGYAVATQPSLIIHRTPTKWLRKLLRWLYSKATTPSTLWPAVTFSNGNKY